MILMPMWIVEETEKGYYALLGSEPRVDADKEWIPKECIVSCVYAPVEDSSVEGSPRFALVTLVTLGDIPEDIKKKNPAFYRNAEGV